MVKVDEVKVLARLLISARRTLTRLQSALAEQMDRARSR